MMRENLTAGAQNAMALVTPTAANGYRFQNRPTAGGTTTDRRSPVSAAGAGWLRLSASATSSPPQFSTNGSDPWTPDRSAT